MASAQLLSQILIISAMCLAGISSLTIPARIREQMEGDEVECTKKIIEILANEDPRNLGDFHGKSDFEKVKALWKESRQMFRNGNNYTKHFEEGLTHAFETDANVEQLISEYVQNATAEMKDIEMTSCMFVAIFEAVFAITKHSMSTGRLGHSDTFLPMVKDIVMSINPDEQTFIDSPPAIFASGFLLVSSLPDFVLSALTLVTYIPENVLEQFVDEFPKAIESFDPVEYAKALNIVY